MPTTEITNKRIAEVWEANGYCKMETLAELLDTNLVVVQRGVESFIYEQQQAMRAKEAKRGRPADKQKKYNQYYVDLLTRQLKSIKDPYESAMVIKEINRRKTMT